MKKKVLAMVLAAAMTASMLAGCSGSGSDKAEDTAAADTEETTSDSAEQTDAPAEGEEKTIGFVQLIDMADATLMKDAFMKRGVASGPDREGISRMPPVTRQPWQPCCSLLWTKSMTWLFPC